MKNILIVFGVLCLQIVFGDFTEEDLPPSHRECLKELNIAAEVLLSNCHANFTVTEDIPDVNKVVYCAYKKYGFLNADDTMDNVKFQNFLNNHFLKMAKLNLDNPEEATLNAIDACKIVQGTEPGDTLVKNFNCVVNYLNKLSN